MQLHGSRRWGILAEMQRGRGKKICLDPSGSPQPHLHASERALSSSCFFYQAHRHSKLVRLDSSVNVGYSEAAAAGAPLLVSPVPGQAPAHLHMALDKHGSHSTTAWSWQPSPAPLPPQPGKSHEPHKPLTLKLKDCFFLPSPSSFFCPSPNQGGKNI